MVSFTNLLALKGPVLFEIRLEKDIIVFRGNDHESSGQLLKGTLVLCTGEHQSLKFEDISLRLTGSLRVNWTDQRVSTTGVTNTRLDRTTEIFSHKWDHFTAPTRAKDISNSKSKTLPPGNYEWDFDLMLPGNLTETVEGLREASITYKLKATLDRGRFIPGIHAYKRVRIIRTLDASALEFLHAMSVENIWPNKVEYSITVPRKAVVFGSSIPLETRFTPLLKGLELGDIKVKLIESQDILNQSSSGHNLREFRRDREVQNWTVPMNRDEHWQDMIEDTGQEGWVMSTKLDLPRRLGRCIQDVNTHGIKIRHKLKMVIALRNPDGHISELRATLPVSIFMSPNIPLGEDGTLLRQQPLGDPASQSAAGDDFAPPVYGEHVLDQLYDELDPTGLQTPSTRSGVSTPTFSHSRAGSADNLQALGHGITPAALSSRLQSVSLERSRRNLSYNSLSELASPGRNSGFTTPRNQLEVTHFSPPPTAPLTRNNSDGSNSPQHVENMRDPPSYDTARKQPGMHLSYQDGHLLPDYFTAISTPNSRANSPPGSPQPSSSEDSAPPAPALVPETAESRSASLERIEEVAQEASSPIEAHSPPRRRHSPGSRGHSPPTSHRLSTGRRRRSSLGFSPPSSAQSMDDEGANLVLLRIRERVI